jgi:hypothetical protein
MTDFNLDEHIVNLLRDEPFFAALISTHGESCD